MAGLAALDPPLVVPTGNYATFVNTYSQVEYCCGQERRGSFIWTFAGSILWIAVFSYLMNWWAATVGRVAGISDGVRIF